MPDTPAIITFTSGSTGEPKAAVRTHGFLIAQHRALVESLALAPGDVDLTTLPMFLLANLASGVTSVIPDADLRAPGAIEPAPVLEQIRAIAADPHRGVAGVPRSPGHACDTAARLGSTASGTSSPAARRSSPSCSTRLRRRARGRGCRGLWIDGGGADCGDRSAGHRAGRSRGDAAGRRAAGRPPAPSIQLRILPDRWGTPVGPWRVDGSRSRVAGRRRGRRDRRLRRARAAPGISMDAGRRRDEDSRGRSHAGTAPATRAISISRGGCGCSDAASAKVIDNDGVLYPFAVECAASDVAGVRRSAFVLQRGPAPAGGATARWGCFAA